VSQSRRQYIRFVESALVGPIESPLAGVVGGVLLGSPAWVDRMKLRVAGGPPQRGIAAKRRLAV